MTSNNVVYVGVDPGKANGVAVIGTNGELIAYDNLTQEQLIDWLKGTIDTYDVKKIVAENYIVFGHKARQHKGSTVPAAQSIGIVRSIAQLHKIPMILQMSNILPIAEKWSGVTMKGQAHSETHWVSAYLHVFYWAHKNGLVKSKLQKEE